MTTFILTVQGVLEFGNAAKVSALLRAEERMHANGHQLGEIAGLMLASFRAEAEGYEDADLFGAPSEIGTLIHGYAEKLRDKVLARAGLSRAEYNGLLALRCDGKQVYELGLMVEEAEW